MPLLKIQTNQMLNDSQQSALVREASASVATALGKPERYVMVSLEQNNNMLFSGSDQPLAYLELKSVGLPSDATQALSRALCELINKNADIDQDRIYIEFSDAPRHMWGWNGSTF